MLSIWRTKMDWRQYETQIYEKLKSEFPGINVLFNQKVFGHQSKVERQVDVLATGSILGHDIKIAVECKCYSKNIDVKIVDGFIGFLEDIKANLGIIITNQGFSPAAKNRADAKDIRLEILSFEEFEEFDFAGMYEEIYEEEAGLDPLPDDEGVSERINEHDDIREIIDMAEEYKGSLSGYLEEILEFYEDIKEKVNSSEDVDYVKDTLNDFISIFHKNDIVSDNKYNYYSIILSNLSLAHLAAFLDDLDLDIKIFNSKVNAIIEECTISENFSFDSNLIMLNNLDDKKAVIYSWGNVSPDRGGSDSIPFRLTVEGEIKATGIVELSYGDYEISDGGYANPTVADDFDLNVRDIKYSLDLYISDSLEIFIDIRDQLYELVNI